MSELTMLEQAEQTAVYTSFLKSPYRSGKYSTYFQTYQALFEQYVGKDITFVEVGVLNGGSLFMWRDFFGPQARIVGVEFNPMAAKWRDHGFEIFIGDQSDEAFWTKLFAEVGQIDVLLDDGGHQNLQQIVTASCAVDRIRDGGMIVIEDVHTSYWRRFGNPSPRSFISFAKQAIDQINARSRSVPRQAGRLRDHVASIEFFESIVALKIDRRLCREPVAVDNAGLTMDAENFFIHDQTGLKALYALGGSLRSVLRLDRHAVANKVASRIGDRLAWLSARKQSAKARKFFR